MADIQKMFGINPEKETNGVWQNMGEEVKILIARMGNKNYTDYLNKLMRPYRRQIRRGNISDDIVEDCINKAIAKHILLGWEGLEQNSKPIEYSTTEALQLLTDFAEFREQIMEIASELKIFQDEEDEKTEKNSSKSSNG